MSLQLYNIDFHNLSSDKRRELFDRINRFSHNGLHFNPDFQSGRFSMDEPYDINLLEIPEGCHLTRIL